MEVLLAIVISVLFAFALRKQIKRYAVSFYIAAADVLFLSGVLFGVSREFAAAVYPYLTRCLLGFSLFALVMYVGALPEGSKARQMLMPIRGELSIIAAIFTIGHVANYLGTYLADILSGFAGMSAGMIASFIVSSLLIVLLAALTVTSFNTVKTRMNSDAWKRLQKTAYAFFGLTYVHLVLVLAPTVSSSGQKAAFSIAAYTAVMLVYVVLRPPSRARKDGSRTSMQEGRAANLGANRHSWQFLHPLRTASGNDRVQNPRWRDFFRRRIAKRIGAHCHRCRFAPKKRRGDAPPSLG